MNHTSFWRRLTRGGRRLHQRPDWEAFAGPGWAERIMQVGVTDDFHAKQGRSTGRWVLTAPGGRRLAVYLKRHYRLPFWHGWLATLWPGGDWSPAMQEYRHLEWAREQGVPVPVPVAAGEFIDPWGKLSSFLVVEELTDMLPLHEEQMPPLAASLACPPTCSAAGSADLRSGRDGPPGAPAARPAALPQGSVPVPLLHPPRRRRPAASRLLRAGRARKTAGPGAAGSS